MLKVLGGLAFVVALVASVMLHEAGHFLTAKRFGMKATQFFLGFGPTLWSRRRGETEYGVKAIPAGGFVKIVGMTQLEEIDPADEPRAFYRQPAGRRAVVLSAGSAMHFLIGAVLFVLALSFVGQTEPVPTVGSVTHCVPRSASRLTCLPTDPIAPALRAGLQAGDRVVAFDGRPVHSADALTDDIRAHGGRAVTLTVRRGRRLLTVHLVPVVVPRESLQGPVVVQQVGAIGIIFGTAVERTNPLVAIGRGFRESVVGTGDALAALPGMIPRLVQARPRTASNSVTSVVGAGQLAGDIVGASGAVADRVSGFLLLVATLNVFVGLFNLLPLLPLDGGHLGVLVFEEARSRAYRLFGRRSPGRVDLTKLLPAAYLVVAIFVGLSVLLVLSDITNPVQNPFG